MPLTSAELYLYFNVTKLLDEKTCDPFEDGLDETRFNGPLFIGVLVTWLLCFLGIIKGVKSIQIISALMVPLSFIFLFVSLGYYITLNDSTQGRGAQFYLGGEMLPNNFSADEQSLYSLLIDSYNAVFFQIGLCVGIHYAYGSYNPIKKPVIMDTVAISISGFLFTLMSGFISWGAIGYLFSV